jgi:ubiquinone biosynthesis protein
MTSPTDLDVGAFSETPPWLVDPGALEWRTGLDDTRRAARAEVPVLSGRRRLPPAARIVRVGGGLVAAVGGWALTERRRPADSRRGLSRRLRRSFERLGPTYIKLGQIISSGEGLFPEELVAEFKLLRDQVPPESFDDVRRVVEEDLGRPLHAVFASFDEAPIAAASIAQVHGATLQTGERVVVKVQRPQVAALVRHDIKAMAWIAPLLVGRIPVAALANPPALVELFTETIVEELDFRLEAENMLDIARVLAETDQRAMVVPRPHPTLVTPRVLVMERLTGFAWDDVEGMRTAGVDTAAIIRAGMISFMEGAMLYGVFHGDLHGGNLFVRPDGRVCLLDFGITGRLDERRRAAFLRLLVGGLANDVRGQLEALAELGALPAATDFDAMIRDLGLDKPVVDPTTLSGEQLVGEIRDLVKKLLGYGARMPKELMLFVKNMVFLDGALATLAPDIDLLGEIFHIATYFTERHGQRIAKDAGLDPTATLDIDLEGVKASMGLSSDVERITPRELAKRRGIVQENLRRVGRRGRRRARD